MTRKKSMGQAAAVRHIHLLLQTSTAMGQQILSGIRRYALHREDWRFGLMNPSADTPASALGPPLADAALGRIQAWLGAAWTPEQCGRVINISRGHDFPHIPSVTCDDTGIGRMAAEYLLGKDLAHFAYYGARCQRAKAFVDRLAQDGHPCSILDPEGGDGGTEQWLENLPRHTGIFTFNDGNAKALIWAAEGVNRAIPEDLAVVGVDNDETESLLSPVPITSVDPNFREVGFQAAKLLDEIFNGFDARETRLRIPPLRVVERESSDFPMIDDPVAIQAARFVQRNACEGINVADVARHMPLSRRPLERRFKEAFGRTILDEIQRVRIGEAARLLVQTPLPVGAVAQEAGFNNTQWLNRVFRTATGLSPAAYRRNQKGDRAGRITSIR